VKEIPTKFRHIYIVDAQYNWYQVSQDYVKELDLVLTFDFALKKQIEDMNGICKYIDDLAKFEERNSENKKILSFLQNWFFNKDKEDIFRYRGISFGKALRISFWSEVVSLVRIAQSLSALQKLKFDNIYLISSDLLIMSLMKKLQLPYDVVAAPSGDREIVYSFDIRNYMQQALDKVTFKSKLINLYFRYKTTIWLYANRVFRNNQNILFLHVYHPTLPLVNKLRSEGKAFIVSHSLTTEDCVLKFLRQNVFVPDKLKKARHLSGQKLLERLNLEFDAKYVLADGLDLTSEMLSVITARIPNSIAKAIATIDSAFRVFDRNAYVLQVMVSSIGVVQQTLDSFFKARNSSSYMIINGLLMQRNLDEAMDADVVNSYSESIKENYFSNGSNVLALGDPRMDQYANPNFNKVNFGRNAKICIGTAAYNNIDLVSYSAIEFEFMYEVVSEIQKEFVIDATNPITVYVRPNCNLTQYQSFFRRFFPDICVKFVKGVAPRQVLCQKDLYISFYSQTIIEAAALGVPTIYHKVDREILDPPFDGKSELIVTCSKEQLNVALRSFLEGGKPFEVFLNKRVLEKYIGFLDGLNVERNIKAIHAILDNKGIVQNFHDMM
jgi:hypothetical protein